MRRIDLHESIGNWLKKDMRGWGMEGVEITGDKMREEDTLVGKIEGVQLLL